PVPSSSTPMSRTPPAMRRTVTCVAPASRALSTSSRTTEAGRSTTSPAAIWLINSSGSSRMGRRVGTGEEGRGGGEGLELTGGTQGPRSGVGARRSRRREGAPRRLVGPRGEAVRVPVCRAFAQPQGRAVSRRGPELPRFFRRGVQVAVAAEYEHRGGQLRHAV